MLEKRVHFVLRKDYKLPEIKVRPKTIGFEIDQLWALREKKRTAEAAVKVIEGDIDTLETALLARLDAQELDKASGQRATVSVGESINGTIEDWDLFTKFISKTKNFQLLHRRVTDTAYRELLAMGRSVPGIKPFTKRKLNLRTIPE